jgi:oxygen-independent coproporphyrinogen-3 oxidase
MSDQVGLYLHIPFCRQRCDFCSFYLELYREQAAAKFLRALQEEIRLYRERSILGNQSLSSLYLGGGTPTAIGAASLVAILTELRTSFSLAPDCEVTVEAHPSTVSKPDIERLAGAGVNRMSFGAESMQDEELVRIGRPGLTSETVNAVRYAEEAGVTNINLDLMYGLPGQSLESWRATVEQCVMLAPTHLSCYALTIEEGTKLARDVRSHLVPAPDDDIQIAMDQTAQDILSQSGFERYEISNYAKPGFRCRHNLLYWTAGEYLGLGPSAQSYLSGARFGNVANLTAYEAALDTHRLPIHNCIALTDEERLRDAVIFGLRLINGIPTRHLHDHGMNYGHLVTIEELRKHRLIEDEAALTKLTSKGRLQADRIAEKLF